MTEFLIGFALIATGFVVGKLVHVPADKAFFDYVSAVGTFLAGIGTLFAAWIAYTAASTWKRQIEHGHQYEAIWNLKKTILGFDKSLKSYESITLNNYRNTLRAPNPSAQQLESLTYEYSTLLDAKQRLIESIDDCRFIYAVNNELLAEINEAIKYLMITVNIRHHILTDKYSKVISDMNQIKHKPLCLLKTPEYETLCHVMKKVKSLKV